ncbi:hypothetical protein, partial [Dickeya zeae]|uniref:hypothetical protein n=1 Tax=Dickeya zeae TaxID=204042 RepID=UPI0020979A6B
EKHFYNQLLENKKYFLHGRFHASLSRYLWGTNSTNETNFLRRDMTAPCSHLRRSARAPTILITL